ncbi:phage major capsid protein [Pediococcus ethanolidurans]|uniref:phage major capsid protein n=1 Tax=Pediococcus ethanolidurans TaxID=319653 RepID=UPI001C1EFE66|nr:phage major capsid protein [Pediococcus ethanolidurans]MBU7554450.1 phage major capsid protein [Pediococcus ethanolidurans]
MNVISKLQNKYRKSSEKCADLQNKINTALLDDSVDAEAVKDFKNDFKNEKAIRDDLREQIAEMQTETVDDSQKEGKDITPKAKTPLDKAKEQINNYIRHKVMKDDATGITSPDVEPIIPEEIIYNPSAEVNSVVDLSTLVTRTPVTNPSGTYPILKRADDTFPSVEELKENPALAKPEFTDIKWSVDTHRGAITLSQESIDDAQVDLTALVGQNINEKRVNTTNKDIAAILEAFTAKSSTSGTLVDDLKHILNVDLDPAYVPAIVASQSLYNVLDTLKDANGQYIFHQDVTSGSGATLLGVPVYKVGDTLLGKAGEAHAFVGDLKRAVLFADRKEVSISWQYDQVYGQYLAGVLRYGVSSADAKAGYFLTVTASK